MMEKDDVLDPAMVNRTSSLFTWIANIIHKNK